jgi:hypothetical protein
MRCDNLVRVFHFASRRNLHRLGHLHHHIRSRNIPACAPLPWSRRIRRIPRRRSCLCPCCDGRDLLRAQRWIIRKRSVARIGKPRRHHPHLDLRRHLARPRPRLLVSHQRHRRSFPTPVATLAFVLQDRNHVFIEGRRRNRLRCLLVSLGAGECNPPRRANHEQRKRPSQKRRQVPHERRNSSVNAQACRAECGSYAARSSQKNP